jgi:tetratricopeptide (TPR) repeat protein
MRRKQVRVVGNCQASAIARLYRDFVGAPALEDVAFVDDLGMDTAALRAAVAGADTVIVQERDFKHGLSREELGGTAEVFTFPLVMAGFLWPFANEAHVHNVPERPISDGPYPSQMSDSFLNRLIVKGVSPEDALAEYSALDIARVASLDRMLELYLDRQRRRDEVTGFAIAPAIEAGFRDQRMFLTSEHPDGPLFGLVAGRLFELMGVPAETVAIAVASLTRSPFPESELPLHPGVIAHFGLRFADADTLYAVSDDGRFTFADYVRRYMRYDNNAELRHALYRAGREDPAATLASLDSALLVSPASKQGHRARGSMLDRLGRRDEAAAAYRRALELGADDADLVVAAARSRMDAGAFDEAEALALRAVEMQPTWGDPRLALAEIRIHAGRVEEALEPARDALRLTPGRAFAFRILGIALARAGWLAEAEGFARRGLALEPGVADHRNLVAEIIEQQGRRREAIELLEEGLANGWGNDQTYSLLGNFWLRVDDLAKAEAAFARGAELFAATRPDLAAGLADVQQLRRSRAAEHA